MWSINTPRWSDHCIPRRCNLVHRKVSSIYFLKTRLKTGDQDLKNCLCLFVEILLFYWEIETVMLVECVRGDGWVVNLNLFCICNSPLFIGQYRRNHSQEGRTGPHVSDPGMNFRKRMRKKNSFFRFCVGFSNLPPGPKIHLSEYFAEYLWQYLISCLSVPSFLVCDVTSVVL